jgi:hypothetical protein
MIRDQEVPHASPLLGNGCLTVVQFRMVADRIQAGKIFFLFHVHAVQKMKGAKRNAYLLCSTIFP